MLYPKKEENISPAGNYSVQSSLVGDFILFFRVPRITIPLSFIITYSFTQSSANSPKELGTDDLPRDDDDRGRVIDTQACPV